MNQATVLDSFDLHGRTALILGGHGPLAEAMAIALAQVGCKLALGARNDGLCVELAQQVREACGVDTLGLRCDVTSEDDVARAIDSTLAKLGSLDILIANAATFWAGRPEDAPVEAWKQVVDVNLTGTFLACQAAGRHMIQQRRGSIINIASTGGLICFPPNLGEVVPYTTTKAAVIKLTKDLAVSWAGHGVRVNAVALGTLESIRLNSEKRRAAMLARIPLGRFGKTSEIATAVVYLASDASSYVTGHTLVVDGGQTIG